MRDLSFPETVCLTTIKHLNNPRFRQFGDYSLSGFNEADSERFISCGSSGVVSRLETFVACGFSELEAFNVRRSCTSASSSGARTQLLVVKGAYLPVVRG